MSFLNHGVGTPLLEDHLCGVYVIAPDPAGPCKIGISANLSDRIQGIQTGCWEPLSIHSFSLCLQKTGSVNFSGIKRSFNAGARSVEAKFHYEMRKMGFGLMGEWFDLSVKDSVDAVRKCAELAECWSLTAADVLSNMDSESTPFGTARAFKTIRRDLVNVAAFIVDYMEAIEKLDLNYCRV